MSATWWGVAGGFLGGFCWSFLISRPLQRWMDKRREMKFLRFIQIQLPGSKVVESISVATSDEDAMKNVERRIRDASRTL